MQKIKCLSEKKDDKIPMKLKNIFFILLYALTLLGDSALAEMSDSEKRAFIESLAVPSTEKRVFYRWQNQERQDELLEADNPNKVKNIFETAMTIDDPYSGPGIYISENPVSSMKYGEYLIQIEVVKGYPFLNLYDEEIQKALKKEGLTNEDVIKLNPRVALTDREETKTHWVLKKPEGVSFKTFNPQTVSNPVHLYEVLNRNKYENVNTSILNEITRRAKNDLSSIVESPFFGDQKDNYDKKIIKEAIEKRIDSISSVREGINMLKYRKDLLTKNQKEEILEKIIPMIDKGYHGKNILEVIEGALKIKYQEKIVNKTIPYMNKTYHGVHMIKETVNDTDLIEKIVKKTIPLVKGVSYGISLIQYSGETLKLEDRKKIAKMMIPLIKNTVHGGALLKNTAEYLKPEDINKIVEKTISLIKNTNQGVTLLTQAEKYLKNEDKNQIIKKSIPLIKSFQDGKSLLTKAEKYLKDEDKSQIIKKIIPLIKTGNNKRFFSYMIKNTDSNLREQIFLEMLEENEDLALQRLNYLLKEKILTKAEVENIEGKHQINKQGLVRQVNRSFLDCLQEKMSTLTRELVPVP